MLNVKQESERTNSFLGLFLAAFLWFVACIVFIQASDTMIFLLCSETASRKLSASEDVKRCRPRSLHSTYTPPATRLIVESGSDNQNKHGNYFDHYLIDQCINPQSPPCASSIALANASPCKARIGLG
jgi:hypothetical protein